MTANPRGRGEGEAGLQVDMDDRSPVTAAQGLGPQGRRALAHVPYRLISLEDAAMVKLLPSLPLRRVK